MIDHTDIRAVIDYKAVGVLQQLISRYDAGEISGEAFKVAVRATFDTVSGLVEDDTMELFGEAGTAPTKPHVERRIFVGGETMVVLLRPADRVALEMITYDKGRLHNNVTRDFESAEKPYKAMREKLDEVIEKMQSKGFHEL